MRPPIEYTVDGEPQTTEEHRLTPRQILENAGIDPTTCYLVRIHGEQQDSYRDKPDEAIVMHPHLKFISVCMSPTPVS